MSSPQETIEVSVTQARAQLGRLLDLAVAGNRVIITKAGFRYAELTPLARPEQMARNQVEPLQPRQED